MRIEISEEVGWTVVLCALFIAATVGALGGCHMVQTTEREAIKAGLVQTQDSGTILHWTKP